MRQVSPACRGHLMGGPKWLYNGFMVGHAMVIDGGQTVQ
jgi:hypothetical protein